MIISFGKYKGTLFKDIIRNDRQYIEWLITTDWFKKRLEHRDAFSECNRLLEIDDNTIKKTSDIIVYTDGACSNNGCENAICGIGVYFSKRNILNYNNISQILDIKKPTNNIAELVAILEALKTIKETYNNEKIILYSDSHYCIKILESWYLKWINEGTIDKRQNVDIIKNLYDNYYTKMNVELKHVKSHSKSKDEHSIGNSEADKLAKLSIYNFKKK